MPPSTSPLLSVIIPTYNRAWILREAIDSVLSQTYRNVELIIVDDGSTDQTTALLERYRDDALVLHQANLGVSAARNAGVAAASGSLIAFLDSDDLWLPGKARRQVAFFQSNPQALVCQTEEVWIRNGRRVNPRWRHRKPSGMIFQQSLELCLVSPSAVMMRRELLERAGGFDESLPACEDYDLWLRIGAAYPVYLIADPLTVKRGGHPDQLSKLPALDRYRITAICKVLDSGCLSVGQYHAALAVLEEKCRIYSQGCTKRGRHREAEQFGSIPRRYD